MKRLGLALLHFGFILYLMAVADILIALGILASILGTLLLINRRVH